MASCRSNKSTQSGTTGPQPSASRCLFTNCRQCRGPNWPQHSVLHLKFSSPDNPAARARVSLRLSLRLLLKHPVRRAYLPLLCVSKYFSAGTRSSAIAEINAYEVIARFKVIQGHWFWCQSKARRDFLWVNNTSHRFQSLISLSVKIIAFDKGISIIDALVLSNLCEHRHKSYAAKNYILWTLFFIINSIGLSSTALT